MKILKLFILISLPFLSQPVYANQVLFPVQVINLTEKGRSGKISYSPDGKYLVFSGNGKIVNFYNLSSKSIGKKVNLVSDNQPSSIYGFSFDKAGKNLIISNGIIDKKLRIINLENFRIKYLAMDNNPRGIFNRNGKLIISGAFSDLYIFQSGNLKKVKQIKNANKEEFGLGLIGLSCCMKDDNYFSTLSDQEVVKLWNLQTGKKEMEFSEASTLQNEFSPNGRFFTMKNGAFNTHNWKKVLSFKKGIRYLSFSPDNNFIALIENGNVIIYSLKRMKESFILKNQKNASINALSFSSNSKSLSAISNEKIYTWNLKP